MNTNAATNTNGGSSGMDDARMDDASAGAARESGAARVGTAAERVARPKEKRAEKRPEKRTAAQVVFERMAMIEVGEPVAHERMVIFPLFVRAVTSPLRYRTLEPALVDVSVEVTEQASATVPELALRNKGD